jgi:hypothetical protein
MNDAQRAYEAKRAAKAGMSLDKWLEHKEKDRKAEVRAKEKLARAPDPANRKPGLFGRLLEKARKPL